MALLGLIGLPAVPLLAEWAITADVSRPTLWITGSIYSVTVGISSRNQAIVGFALAVGGLMGIGYGALAKVCIGNSTSTTCTNAVPSGFNAIAIIIVLLISVTVIVLQRDVDLRLQSHGTQRTLKCLTARCRHDFSRRSLPCDFSRRLVLTL